MRVEHAPEILARGRAVAPAEHDLHPRLDGGADRDRLVLGIDADQVAHEVVASVGPGHRQPDVDRLRRPPEVAASLLLQFGAQHVERRPPVERDDDVALAFGHLVAHRRRARTAAERRAPLGEPGGELDPGGQDDARQPALQHVVRDLEGRRPGARQPAHEIAARDLRRHVLDQLRHVVGLRVAVHDREVRGLGAALGAAPERRRPELPREHLELARRQRGEHHRNRRLVEVLHAAR